MGGAEFEKEENGMLGDKEIPKSDKMTSDSETELKYSTERGKGKNKFRSVGINILSKVIEDHIEEDEAEDEQEGHDISESKGKLNRSASLQNTSDTLPKITPKPSMKPNRRLSMNDLRSQDNRRKTLPILDTGGVKPARRVSVSRQISSTDRAPSLIAIVGLMTFRKLYQAKMRRDEIRQARRQSEAESYLAETPTTPEPPQIHERDIKTPFLPSKPRFAATLSSEGQFATLKGYEDMILDRLENTYPSRLGFHWSYLRTKTPMTSVAAWDKNADSDSEYNEFQRSDDNKSLHSPDNGSLPPLCVSNHQISEPKTTHLLKKRHNSRKQRRITYRLEYAMGMLDKIKEEKGEVITSPRKRQLQVQDPIETCEDWIHGWKQEFPAVSSQF